MMEDAMMKRYQIPAFGKWEYCDELPITQYFESAMQAGLVRGHYFGEDVDLFKVPAAPAPPAYTRRPRKVKKSASRSGGRGEKQHSREQQRKQGRRVCDVTGQVPTPRRRAPAMAPKAVDEDLYKIPPELLYQKPKRKSNWLLGGLLSGCLGLNCVA